MTTEKRRSQLEGARGMEWRTATIDRVEGRTLHGYAARYNTWSHPILPGTEWEFKEQIAPGAFDESVSNGGVSLFWQHNHEAVLANQSSGTLKLYSDEVGLRYEATLGDTPQDDLYLDRVARGLVREMSFGFRVRKDGDQWSKDQRQRTLRSVELREISVVERGAYPGTSAAKRSRSDKMAYKSKILLLAGAAFTAALPTTAYRDLREARNELKTALAESRADGHEATEEERDEIMDNLDAIRAEMASRESQASKATRALKRDDPDKAGARADEQRDTKEYRDQWLRWARGRGPAPELRETLYTSNSGIHVPKQYEDEILKYADAVTVIRNKAYRRSGITGIIPVRINTQEHDDYMDAWTGEDPTETENDTALSEVNFEPTQCYPYFSVSTKALLSSDFDLESELVDDLKRKIAKTIEWGYTIGTGSSNQPTGCFKSDTNTSQLQTTAAHASGAGWDAQVTLENLRKLRYRQLPVAYWPGAEWYMSQDYYAAIADLDDDNGRPLFTPDANAGATKGAGMLLLGAPVNICAFAPARQVGASVTVPCFFGNLYEGMRIHEWAGVPAIRDEITTPGRILFKLNPFVQSKLVRTKAIAQHRVTLT